MYSLKKQAFDPFFRKKFRIQTPIQHVFDVTVEAGIRTLFEKDWKKFYKKARSLVSKTRKKSLLACMHKIEKEQSDDEYSKRVLIKYIGKNVGYGVFAKEDIPPYSTLNHYAGILRLDKEIEMNNDSTFNFTDFNKYSIDAVRYGNWTRFMNHADLKDPSTNVIPWELYLPQGPRIVFTSGSRGILKGEQLLYSYGDLYWDEEEGFTQLS